MRQGTNGSGSKYRYIVLVLLAGITVLSPGCREDRSDDGGGDDSTDRTPPSVSIRAPADGSFVAGGTAIEVEASDNVGVSRVVVYVDDDIVRVFDNAPYELELDSALYVDGDHAIRATARDDAGNNAESSISVTVDNTAPTVEITSPESGETLSGEVVVQAAAADNLLLARVDFLVGGSLQSSLLAPPYEWTLDTNTLADGAHTFTVTACDAAGNVGDAQIGVQVDNGGLPPDPGTVAPEIDRTVAASFLSATAFLYSGDNPIQTGVAPDTMEKQRAAVLRGQVIDRNGDPISGVNISIHHHPEYGQTLSREDGWYDLAVNGGGTLVVHFAKSSLLTVQRHADVPWNDYVVLPEVVMIPVDSEVTEITLSAPGVKLVRGSEVTDASGPRRATLLVPEGTTAQIVLPDGSRQSVDTVSIRATEYTVGSRGPESMPAELPPASGYTYALEYTVDEALAAGATRVDFSQPLCHYVEDIVGFPVGGAVPTGYYDREQARWIPSTNGRVVQVIDVAGGIAEIDTDGDAQADDAAALAMLGITGAERTLLAGLYAAGQVLWRVPIPHFTPWDCNWPYGPPDDAEAPDEPEANPWDPEEDEEDPCVDSGSSIIETQNRVLREVVPVVGTPVSLHYRSDRVRGNTGAYSLDVPVTGTSVPGSLKRVSLSIKVLGRGFSWTWSAAEEDLSSITQHFQWDGLDFCGRPHQGTATALVQIAYIYDAVYYPVPADFDQAFGRIPQGSSVFMVPNQFRAEVAIAQIYTSELYAMDIKDYFNYGGWSLSLHHAYDTKGQILELGNGRRRTVGAYNGSVLNVAAGTGVAGYSGDGGPATEAQMSSPHALTVTPDGSVYVADTVNNVIRRIAPDGIMSTEFGQIPLFGLASPRGIAVGDDGSLYIAEYGGHRIRRKTPDGMVTVFAGIGPGPFGLCSSGGDGGPATEAEICNPAGLAFGPDGSLYVAEVGAGRIRCIAPDGIITTVAGGGTGGDGGPATEAALNQPQDVAVGRDGSIYIADTYSHRIRKVGTDGIITTVAGTSMGYSGDGGPATAAQISYPMGIAVDREGKLYIAETAGDNSRIRQVRPDGIISTLAGGGTEDSAIWSRRVQLKAAYDVALAPDGSVVLAERDDHRIDRVQVPLPGVTTDDFLIPSENGAEYYHFDPDGRHLETYHALTGQLTYAFSYDASGYLASITDADGKVTAIERDVDGAPQAIVGPFGERTVLTLDVDGYMAGIRNPEGETFQFEYVDDGLLVKLTDPEARDFNYTFDNRRRLSRVEDPAGGCKDLVRTSLPEGYEVTQTTAEGYVTIYEAEFDDAGPRRLRKTYRDGTVKLTEVGADGTGTVTYGDGTLVNTVMGPDPRWGMSAPILERMTIVTPALLKTMEVTCTRSFTLVDPADSSRLATLTSALDINGRVSMTHYDRALDMITHTSPEGRRTIKVIDSVGRMKEFQVADFATGVFTYDAGGRITEYALGTGPESRTYTFGYDAQGRLSMITDPLLQTVQLVRDNAGRVTRIDYDDGRQAGLAYDNNGRVTEVFPPERPGHGLGYTAVGMPSTYSPPGTGNQTSFQYNLDRQPISITRPGGEVLAFTYDPDTGRLQEIATASYGTINLGYTAGGQVESISTDTAGAPVNLRYGYDGSLLTYEETTGPFTASVSLTYDDDFRMQSETLVMSGSWPVSYTFDSDKLLTAAGALSYTRNAANGLVSSTSLGNVATERQYSSFGEVHRVTATYVAQEKYSASYQRDKLGRIAEKTESVDGGSALTCDYDYDGAGRLILVTESEGAAVTGSYGYTYDANGNRTSHTDRTGTVTTATGINDEDQILAYGDAAYTYDPVGNRRSKVLSGQTTTYTFDVRNFLRAVTLPSGTSVEYVLDGLGRRVGKKVNGALVQAYVYRGGYHIIGVLDVAGDITSRFVYGAKRNVPEYMVKEGGTYRLVSDHLGSVRLVVDISDGSIVQRIDYDAFGVVESDTNPGFQPFAFAGGLYDRDTGLTHFGAREYDAELGRWLSKDPVLFLGGDFNLYAYVKNDPVNRTDMLGLRLEPCQPWRWEDLEELLDELEDVDPEVFEDLVRRGEELEDELDDLREEIDEMRQDIRIDWYDLLTSFGDQALGTLPFLDSDAGPWLRDLFGITQPNFDSAGYAWGSFMFSAGSAFSGPPGLTGVNFVEEHLQ